MLRALLGAVLGGAGAEPAPGSGARARTSDDRAKARTGTEAGTEPGPGTRRIGTATEQRLQAEGRGKNKRRKEKSKKKRGGRAAAAQPPPPPPDGCCGTESCADPEPGSTSAGCDFAGDLRRARTTTAPSSRHRRTGRSTSRHRQPRLGLCRGLPAGRFLPPRLAGRQHLGDACLFDADFTGADLGDDRTLFDNALFCNTTMPDGSVNDRDCDTPTACCRPSWAAATPAGVRPTAATRPAAPRPVSTTNASSRRWSMGQARTICATPTVARAPVAPTGPPSATPVGSAAPPTAPTSGAAPTGVAATAAPVRPARPALPRAGSVSATPGPATTAVPPITQSASRGPRPRPAAAAARPASAAAPSRSVTTGSAARRTARANSAVRTGAAAVAALVSRANGVRTASASATRKAARTAAASGPAPASRGPRTRPVAPAVGAARRAGRGRAASTSGARSATREHARKAAARRITPARRGRPSRHCGGPGGAPCVACSDTQTCQNRQCVECGNSCPCSGQSICADAGAPNVVCPLIPATDLGECFVTLTGQPVCSSNSSNLACNTDADCRELAANAVCVNGKQPNNPQPQCEPNPFCVIPGTPAVCDPPCPSGQRCSANGDQGQCICDGLSCPDGCCSGGPGSPGRCLPSTSSQCGALGAMCVDCPTSTSCNAQGHCVCTPQSCPTGCCDGNACQPGTAFEACGAGGGACTVCSGNTPACGQTGCIPCAAAAVGTQCRAPDGNTDQATCHADGRCCVDDGKDPGVVSSGLCDVNNCCSTSCVGSSQTDRSCIG